jgi:glycosyltransferase involved in cell wall biosynthesis
VPNQALVSIIIPTFNRAAYIADAIDSCLAQTYPNLEIIVVDDGSSDGTGTTLRQRYGQRIRYVYQENRGPGIARNRGIALARGEYIHFLDADDQLHFEKIAIGLAAFRRHPEVSVIHSHYQQVASDGVTPVETGPFESYSDDVYCELLRQTGCRVLISSSMFRSEALREVGGFADDERFRSAEDWDLFLRLALQFRFHGINQKLVYRRMHNSMISDDKLYGAYGRLKTIQNAREYGWKACMTAAEFDRLEAARHHVYALYLWQAGQRTEARRHFLSAAKVYPPLARQRRLYAFYARFLPPVALDLTLGIVHGARRIAGR